MPGNRCAIYPPGCDGSQLRARHGQAPQVRKYNWRWRAAFTILCLFPSLASSCQTSQKASATPTMVYDSLSLSLSLSLSPACQPSQKASATPTVFSRRRLSIPQTAVAAAAAASRVQFAPRFDHVSESES